LTNARPFRAALERRAGQTPEDPFLFFRGERGHFRWWSFARAAACLAGAPAGGGARPGEEEAEGFLRRADEVGSAAPAAGVAAALGPALAERDIWISHRPLGASPEADLALWAAESGAAVLREPGERLHPGLFGWARPTLLSSPGAALEELLAGFGGLAPRFGARRWARRRLARLRAVLVEAGEVAPVREMLVALGAPATLRVLPFPGSGLGLRQRPADGGGSEEGGTR